jgi:hypothetical protein
VTKKIPKACRKEIAALFACATLVACASAPPSGARTISSKPMPYGLTCDRCMYGHVQDCGWAAEAPVAAVVSGSQQQEVHRRCLAEPGPEFPAVCLVERLYRFESARFLKNDSGATATDSFEVHTTYDEVFTNDIERHATRGVVLEPGARYAIFAGADRKDMGYPADWYINIACALHDAEQ